MAITQQQRERYDRLRQAILNSYHAEAQVAKGDLTYEESQNAQRRMLGEIFADAISDGSLYERLREGDGVALCPDNDVGLEQLALSAGYRSEMHDLLRRPLSLDDLQNAVAGYEQEGMSARAISRAREVAYRQLQRNMDMDAVAAGELSQADAEAREVERTREVQREQGIYEVSEPDDVPEELPPEPEPQYAQPPANEFEAAERGDMEAYMEFARRRDKRERIYREHDERAQRYAAAGYSSDGTRNTGER